MDRLDAHAAADRDLGDLPLRPVQDHRRRGQPGDVARPGAGQHHRHQHRRHDDCGDLAMIALLGVAAPAFKTPYFDYLALAPEILLTGVALLVMVVDLMVEEVHKSVVSKLAGIGILASFIPIAFMAVHGISGHPRSMFGGAYQVDVFSLVMKGLFLGIGYVILLMSTTYIEEGDYYEGEFAFLILCSLLGMMVMSSARDLITIFIALELLSIPGYLLAGWRKRDLKSNEPSLKYYLLGVLATGVMLYGMSLIFGATGTTVLTGISSKLAVNHDLQPLVTIGIFFVIIGFAFKVSAVP